MAEAENQVPVEETGITADPEVRQPYSRPRSSHQESRASSGSDDNPIMTAIDPQLAAF